MKRVLVSIRYMFLLSALLLFLFQGKSQQYDVSHPLSVQYMSALMVTDSHAVVPDRQIWHLRKVFERSSLIFPEKETSNFKNNITIDTANKVQQSKVKSREHFVVLNKYLPLWIEGPAHLYFQRPQFYSIVIERYRIEEQ